MLILHLSDIHIKESDNELSFMPMYESIKHKIIEESTVVLIITGDVAYSGLQNEYLLFDSLLKKVIKQVEKDHQNVKFEILLIPGNHDCDFQNKNEIRNIVVDNVKKSGCSEDESIFNLCTSIQDNFYSYLSTIDRSGEKKGRNRLHWKKVITEGDKEIHFNLYNTAWLSSMEEDPGSLYYPTEILTEINDSTDLSVFTIGAYHHPDNWLSPKHDEQNHREFRNHVTRNNNLILSGHEHQEHLEKYNDLSNGHDCYIHEGSAFFQDNIFNGFCAILLEKDGSFELEEYTYDPKKNLFKSTDKINQCSKTKDHVNHNYQLQDDFKDYLNDTEVFVSSSTNSKMTLKEIFTYPKLENISTEELVNSEDILKDDKQNNLVLFGVDQSGKTAILKMIYSYWYYHGLTPILLDATKNITNENIRQILKNTYKKQYNFRKKSFDEYLSLEYEKKIILVDNFHLLKEKIDRDTILKKLKSFSKKLILICDDISALEETSLGNEENTSFEKYSIMPFGHLNRDQIIEKWLYGQNLDKQELHESKSTIHNQLSDILGTNLVPSYPLFILTILQALEATNPSKTEITSYGHCYQTLIYYSFKKNGLKDDEFDVVDNFLSHLANNMFDNKSLFLSYESLKKIFDSYSDDFVVTKDFGELIHVLLESKTIIEDTMGNYRFKYVYIYYYYVAKYISKFRISDKPFIESLCQNLEKKENSFIILFITYHSDNQDIIEEIIFNTMDQFTDIEPITLINSETNFMNESVEEASSTVLKNIKPEEYRREELISKDKNERKLKESNSDVNENLFMINKALKSIEINGQLLKIRYGTINKNRLKSIIEESFLICYRLIRFLITDLSNEDTASLLADQFEEYIRMSSSKISSQPTREELISAILKLLSNITYYVCHFTLDRTAFFIGNVKLMDMYEEIAEKIDSPAAKLTLMLIGFKTSRRLDRVKLKSLKEEFEENSFAFSILQKSAVNYVYMHHLSHEDKGWIASFLDIPIENQRKIENKKSL